VRESLPEAEDVFGRKVEQRRTAAIDPTLTTTARDGAVERELLRLNLGIAKAKQKGDETPATFRARRLARRERCVCPFRLCARKPCCW